MKRRQHKHSTSRGCIDSPSTASKPGRLNLSPAIGVHPAVTTGGQ